MRRRAISDLVLSLTLACGIGLGESRAVQSGQAPVERKTIRSHNPKRARIAGRLIDTMGKPVADELVYLFPTKRSDVVITDNLSFAPHFTDKEGRFSIDYVGSGRAVLFYRYGDIKKIQIRAGRSINLGTVVIQGNR